jgi:hypothetical protein
MTDEEKRISEFQDERWRYYFSVYGEIETKLKLMLPILIREQIAEFMHEHDLKDSQNHSEVLARIEKLSTDNALYVNENKNAIKTLNTLVTGTSFMRGMLIWVAGWVIPIGVIIGAIYGIKEWIRK